MSEQSQQQEDDLDQQRLRDVEEMEEQEDTDIRERVEQGIVQYDPQEIVKRQAETGIIEVGRSVIGEMVAMYEVTCPGRPDPAHPEAPHFCGQKFMSQHPVMELDDVLAMCPKCNKVGKDLERVTRLALSNEFEVKYLLAHSSSVHMKDEGIAYPVRPEDTWMISRKPFFVGKKYGIHLPGGRYLGLFGPMVGDSTLDTGDRQVKGRLRPRKPEDPISGTASYMGTSILFTYIFHRGKLVEWEDSREMPVSAWDEMNRSPHTTHFEVDWEKAAKRKKNSPPLGA